MSGRAPPARASRNGGWRALPALAAGLSPDQLPTGWLAGVRAATTHMAAAGAAGCQELRRCAPRLHECRGGARRHLCYRLIQCHVFETATWFVPRSRSIRCRQAHSRTPAQATAPAHDAAWRARVQKCRQCRSHCASV
jgi:hypothetical protein